MPGQDDGSELAIRLANGEKQNRLLEERVDIKDKELGLLRARIAPLPDDCPRLYDRADRAHRGEAHLRLLLRELTHRSKNLLAVFQGMARHTAKHARSIDAFLEQFSARLQALAVSHDVLVRERWYGASLKELIQSQLGRLFDDDEKSHVILEGLPGA